MDCPRLPEIGYGEFSARLHGQVVSQRIPIDGTLELTFRCNLRCSHCYCNLPAGDGEVRKSELTTQEVSRILDEITQAGCFNLLLTGGEPLLREDFREIYVHAKRKGLLITLFTNATLITQDLADLFGEYPPFLVDITLYGATAETYEKVTRVPGSFERFRRGIDLLRERGIPLQLKSMMMTLNYGEFRAMRAFVEGLGMTFRFDPLINPRLNGSMAPCGVRLSPEHVVALDLDDERRRSEFRKSFEEYDSNTKSPFVYYCAAGEDSFSVSPYGRLQMCQMIAQPFFDLRKESFRCGWKHFLPRIKQTRKDSETRCDHCRIRPLCAPCPAWSELEAGDPAAPVEYLCQVARLREKAFGLQDNTKKEVSHATSV